MIAFIVALAFCAPPKPVELKRGKVVLPVLGLELDLTPAAGGKAGATWRVSATVTGDHGVDLVEATIDGRVIGQVRIAANASCNDPGVEAPQKLATSVAGTWLTWEVELKEPMRVMCLDATEQHPSIMLQRIWFDPAFKLPAADDPILSAVAFALRDGHYGNARPLGDAKRVVRVLGRDVKLPNDGSHWIAEKVRGTTVVRRVLPVLPFAAIVVQRSADPAACPAKLKRGQWGALGPVMRCRPDKAGPILVELRGPSELVNPWLDRL